MENILRTKPALFLLIIVYFFFLPQLLSYDQAWMNPEEFVIKSYILENGRTFGIGEFKKAFNWEALEFAPRPTRPLSSCFEIIDAKFRSWLWRYLPPHPSVSLSWFFSLVLTPWLLYLFLRNLNVGFNTAVWAICIYLLTPAVLGSIVMLFRPAKIMTNFFMILCLFVGSLIQKNQHEGKEVSWKQVLFLTALVFISLFWDETAFLIYPAIFVFYFSIFRKRIHFITFLSVPILMLLFYYYVIPYLTVQVGSPRPYLNSYFIFDKISFVYIMNLGSVIYQNSVLLILDTAGIVPVSKAASIVIKILSWSALVSWIFILFCIKKSFSFRKSIPWLLAAVILILFYAVSLAISNGVWGPYYYGNFWSLFFSILLCQFIKGEDSGNSFRLTFCAFIICLNLFCCFMETNQIYKKWHYYPYHPLKIMDLFKNKIQRFDPQQKIAFAGKDLKEMVLDYQMTQKQNQDSELGWKLPKELLWLPLEVNPGKHHFYYQQLWGDSRILFYTYQRNKD